MSLRGSETTEAPIIYTLMIQIALLNFNVKPANHLNSLRLTKKY